MLKYINDFLSIPLVKIVFVLGFFLFFYDLILDIMHFMGVKKEISSTYILWICVILILLAFLPEKMSYLYD
jgi:hypothetical protein